MKKNSIRIGIAAVAHVLLLFVISYAFFFGDNEDTAFKGSDVVSDSVQWNIENIGSVELPVTLMCERDEQIHIYGVLPDEIEVGTAVSLLSIYSRINVFVDGEKIYSYGSKDVLNFGRMSGNIRVLARLTPEMAGKEIDIYISPSYSQHADISKIYLGHIDGLIIRFAKENMSRYFLIVFLLCIMIIGVFLALSQVFDKKKENLRLYLSFTFFVMIVLLWIFCSSDIPQFITSRNEFISLISYMCLSIITIPYLVLCSEINERHDPIYEITQCIGWVVPIINVVGFVFNLFDPPEVLFLSHIMIVVSAIGSCVELFANRKQSKEANMLFRASCTVVVAVFIGLGFYMIAPSQGYAAIAVGIGMLVFIFQLLRLVLYRQTTYIRERRYIDAYKELTTKDFLADVHNRTAFEKDIKEAIDYYPVGTSGTLYLFDINELKRINSEKGFTAGDNQIKALAGILSKAFDRAGTVYRMGGDEFGVFVIGDYRTPEGLIKNFEKSLASYNQGSEVELSVAYGWHKKAIIRSDSYIRDLYRFADQALYASKQKAKSKY